MEERRMQHRKLSDESGFTLPELLIALVIALIVSFATFSLIEVAMRKAGDTEARVKAAQQGRMAMDTVVRQLRSQVCLNNTVNPTPPMSPPAGFGTVTTSTTAVFYTDFTDAGKSTTVAPELHVLTYDAATLRLIERDYPGTMVLNPDPKIGGYIYTYPLATAPARTKLLAESVIPLAGVPIFAYYTYNTATPPRPEAQLNAPATGMLAADTARVARVVVNFRALTTSNVNNLNGSSVFQDEVTVRAADPNDEAPTPTCA
jgi:prepilin-type N-terminal cleavage/methylation domain-containing protein